MPKIVYAPILEQTGFLKRKALTSLVNYVARLDGATQYWQLSEAVVANPSDSVSLEIDFTVDGSPDSEEAIIGGSGTSNQSNFVIYIRPNGFVSVRIPLSGGGSVFMVVGEYNSSAGAVNKLVFSKVGLDIDASINGISETRNVSDMGSIEITRLAAWGANMNLNGVVKNFKYNLNGDNGEIPLTNKAQGATQLATVGNVNATLVNYTEAVWEEV